MEQGRQNGNRSVRTSEEAREARRARNAQASPRPRVRSRSGSRPERRSAQRTDQVEERRVRQRSDRGEGRRQVRNAEERRQGRYTEERRQSRYTEEQRQERQERRTEELVQDTMVLDEESAYSEEERVPERRGGGDPQSRHVRDTITKWRMYGVFGFTAIMLLGGVIGLLFFARPTTSAVEMRNLTPFPEITFERFKDGSFFTDVSLWYADTYPLREPMVAADHAVDSLFGVSVNGAMVGGNVVADEIPVDEGESSGSGESQQPEVTVPADPPDERVVAEDVQNNIMEGVYTKDGAAYSIYYFDQVAADTYIQAMNTAAEKLDGVATVYSIMSPANSIMLDEEEALKVGGSDQQQTLNYLSSRYDSRVKQVEIVDDIIDHRGEYLYFYTDHHWTQLGAYYAYRAFCETKGIEPHDLSYWHEENYGEFRGTYYDTIAATGSVREDTVEAHVPNGTNVMRYWPNGTEGEEAEAPVVDAGAAEWDPSYKYSAFIQGDQPLEIIENPAVTDDSSCLVVKDSYGCAFVPWLVDHYQTVYVIDFRETDKNICDYVKENGIKDVIFMTGMKIGLTESVATTLLSEVS